MLVSTPSGGGSGDSGSGGSSVAGQTSSGGKSASGGQPAGTSGQAAAGEPAKVNGVVIAPADARAGYASNVQFTALVTGAEQSVTWSIQEGERGGSIDATGLYKAPGTSGSFHVVATSTSDAKLTGTARVTVSAPSGTPPVLVPGTWTELTPSDAGLVCCPETGGNSYGVLFVEVDPGDPNTIYTGIDALGIWKTTDRGSTWKRLGSKDQASAGPKTTYIDTPIRLRVDPADSKHLYATSGVHGSTMGFWVSNDGGDNWEMPAGFNDSGKTTTLDVTLMAVDPSDFKHVLLASHSPWKDMGNAGILESKDGGQSWQSHAPAPSWNAGTVGIAMLYAPAQGIGDSKTWLVGTDGNGFWRTTDSGTTWNKVSDSGVPHGGNEIYYTADGVLYAGATPYPMRSKDNGVTWEQLNDGLGFSYYYLVYGDGKTLYTSPAYTGTNGGAPLPYYAASETSGGAWTPHLPDQKLVDGPYQMKFDAANGIMYSANFGAGLLALKVIPP